MFILTFLFALAVLVIILMRFGVLKKAIKWVLLIIACFGVITCIGVFIFLDDIKKIRRVNMKAIGLHKFTLLYHKSVFV